jgi:iron complex outermembrane receptor protein
MKIIYATLLHEIIFALLPAMHQPRALLPLLLLFPCLTWAQISGTVTDERHDPLPGAHVLLLPDSLHSVTDSLGTFALGVSDQGEKVLRVTYIGHEPMEMKVAYRGRPVRLSIDLHLHAHGLDEVVVEEHHSSGEASLNSHHMEVAQMEMAVTGTLARALDDVSGLNMINVGVGIAKPVIRGLSGNRIIVTTDNIKQEGQQWGLDHGLEVDPYDVGDIEILKGPASLQYGSDGLGGVINIQPRKAPALNSVEGQVLGTFRSNNLHAGGSATVGINSKNIFGRAHYSRQEFADYAVPADSFTYQGFRLPITDRQLKNTAGKEHSGSISVGVLREKMLLRLYVSHYALDAGLFSGAVGIPRSYALGPDGDTRDVDKPAQKVRHLKAVFTQEYYGDRGDLHIHLGYQRNDRKELSFPEYHSQAVRDLTDTLALGLLLHTGTLSAHFEHRVNKKLRGTYGIDGQVQQNIRSGFEHLLPDYFTTRAGAYAIMHWHRDARTTVTGGLRLDHGYNSTPYRRQYVYASDGTVRDSLVSPATEGHFFNISGSIGLSHGLIPGRWELKAHAGKSFRVPHPSETVSNGVHHGTFRHEMGNQSLRSEHGYQIDVSNHVHLHRLTATVTGFFNFFQDYIYLGPSGRFSTLPEAGQIYAYRQDNAIFTGAEAEWQWDIWRGAYAKQVFDMVWNLNLSTGTGLPFTPPPALMTELGWKLPDVWKLDNASIYVRHRHVWAQDRVDRNERPTPGYDLLEAGIGTRVRFGRQAIDITLSAQNLLDTPYLNHLSRYRLINVVEQGRNVVLTLRVPFSSPLSK